MKKFAAILALQELLIEAQYITFNILFMTDGYFMLISNLIRYLIIFKYKEIKIKC